MDNMMLLVIYAVLGFTAIFLIPVAEALQEKAIHSLNPDKWLRIADLVLMVAVALALIMLAILGISSSS